MNITAVVNELSSIEACWILENKKAILVEYGKRRKLPVISIEHKDILDALNISYIKETETTYYEGIDYCDTFSFFEIRDKSCFEEEEYTLPIYKRDRYGFKRINPKYTGKTYTIKTIEEANKLYYKARYQIKIQETINYFEDLFLKSRAGVVVSTCPWPTEIYATCLNNRYAVYQFLYKGRDGRTGISSNPYLTAIVNLNKVDSSGNIDILVPEGVSIGKLIGEKGWQAKRLAEFLGVKHVTFKPES